MLIIVGVAVIASIPVGLAYLFWLGATDQRTSSDRE
jgi:hypothetical protein